MKKGSSNFVICLAMVVVGISIIFWMFYMVLSWVFLVFVVFVSGIAVQEFGAMI